MGAYQDDTPKGQKIVASSNEGQMTKDTKTTESQTTRTSERRYIAFQLSRMLPCLVSNLERINSKDWNRSELKDITERIQGHG